MQTVLSTRLSATCNSHNFESDVSLFMFFSIGCTGIVANNANGTIIHGRNLVCSRQHLSFMKMPSSLFTFFLSSPPKDYNGVPYLNQLSINVNWVKNNSVVFRQTTFAGYVGALTGMRPYGFSVSLDERDKANDTHWNNAIAALLEHGKPAGFAIREELENTALFEDALENLSNVHLVSRALGKNT